MPRRSSRPIPATKAGLQREVRRLRKRLDAIEWLAGDFYQFFGNANAPVRFLDAAVAIGSGWPLKRRTLKKLTRPELDAIGKEFGTRG